MGFLARQGHSIPILTLSVIVEIEFASLIRLFFIRLHSLICFSYASRAGLLGC